MVAQLKMANNLGTKNQQGKVHGNLMIDFESSIQVASKISRTVGLELPASLFQWIHGDSISR